MVTMVDEAWEVVSVVSELSFVTAGIEALDVIVADDELCTCSLADSDDFFTEDAAATVCTATGYPALHTKEVEAKVVPSYKDALLLGAGGPLTAKAVALSKAPTQLARVARKPRKAKVSPKEPLEEDLDLDAEYYDRKATGQRLYFLRAPNSRARGGARSCEPIAESGPFDDDDDEEDDEY